MQIIETMTPQRACERLRETGMSVGLDTMRAGIEQGAYPFGICIRTEKGNPVYQIFGKLLEDWIRERAIEKGD